MDISIQQEVPLESLLTGKEKISNSHQSTDKDDLRSGKTKEKS